MEGWGKVARELSVKMLLCRNWQRDDIQLKEMSLRRLELQHHNYHTYTRTRTRLTHADWQRGRERWEKAQQSPPTNTSDRWMMKGCEGMGWVGDNNSERALLRLLMKKGLTQRCDTWEGKHWQEMNVLKEGRWLSCVDTKVWGWCSIGEIFNAVGAFKTHYHGGVFKRKERKKLDWITCTYFLSMY